jgi:hypothetical protein
MYCRNVLNILLIHSAWSILNFNGQWQFKRKQFQSTLEQEKVSNFYVAQVQRRIFKKVYEQKVKQRGEIT